MVKIQVNSQGKAYYTGGGKVLISGGSSGKYQLLDRITDDSNNEIGSVSGFFTDANDVEYAVVCLDAQYRTSGTKWCSSEVEIPNLPFYENATWGPWEAKETATFNTQKILDHCSAHGYASTACSYCRGLSFTIDGTTYYGQLPNVIELSDIAKNHTALNNADPTASSYSEYSFSVGYGRWSSSQYDYTRAWGIGSKGEIDYFFKDGGLGALPVLEIPNA